MQNRSVNLEQGRLVTCETGAQQVRDDGGSTIKEEVLVVKSINNEETRSNCGRALDNKDEGDQDKDDTKQMGPRERLKRHRREVAGQVWIPEMWGQEVFLKDWIDCTAFDASLVGHNIMLARASLMGQPSRVAPLPLENSC